MELRKLIFGKLKKLCHYLDKSNSNEKIQQVEKTLFQIFFGVICKEMNIFLVHTAS